MDVGGIPPARENDRQVIARQRVGHADNACSRVSIVNTKASTHAPTMTAWRSWGGIRALMVSFTASSRSMAPIKGRWSKRLTSITSGTGVGGDLIRFSC
jgi:hypothetical protein